MNSGILRERVSKRVSTGKLIHLFWILIFSCNYLLAQHSAIYFKNYSTEQGLPSPEVHCIHQDRDGYLWFGTDNGVARFDGYEFQSFTIKNGLGYNVIVNILEDETGRLWFSAMNGEVYIFMNNQIIPYKFNSVLTEYRGDFIDAQLCRVEEDLTLTFLLKRCGILAVDSTGNSELISCSEPYSFLLYKDKTFTAIAKCDCLNFEAYSGDQDSTIVEILNSDNQSKTIFTVEEKSRRTSQVYAFRIDSSNSVFGYLGKMHFIRDCQPTFVREEPLQLYALALDHKKGIWVGMSNSRGLRYYASHSDFENNTYEQFLLGKTVTSIKFDLDGGLWIGTLESGVFYSANQQLKVFEKLGFNEDAVSAVAFKSDLEIIVGSKDGRVTLLSLPSNNVEDLPFTDVGVSSLIHDIFYDPVSSQIWTDEERLLQGKINRWIYDRHGHRRFYGKKYYYDMQTQLLWVIKGQGFCSLRPSDAFIYPEARNFTLKDRFFAIYVDANGRIWTGGNNGLAEWVDPVLIPVKNEHPAFSHRIEDIDAFEGEDLIFGTKGYGVIIWKDQKVFEVNSSNGLASDMIEDVHVDENNIAWIATLNGLSKITMNSDDMPRVRTFSIDNGLPSNEIYQIKSFRGQPWLCTGGGLVKWIDTPFDSTSNSPSIQKLWINGEESFGNVDQFDHQHNNLTFDFLTIDYQQFGNINYRYRLSGEEDWTNTKNHSINFARLAPGSYQFEVQSQNKDGVWSQSTCYGFVVNKPWYGRWWFFVTSLLVGILLIYFLLTWWIKRKEEKISLKREMDELKKSALQAQMNPHFIFNCLNSIQGYVNAGKREEANSYLLNFSHLIRGCLNASIDRKITLAQDISFIENYLNLEKMRFSPEFDYEIKVTSGIDPERIYIEPMLVLPFVENAVIHGLSRSDRQGRIYLKYEMVNEIMQVTIEDNGPGLGKSNYQASSHKSVGITITRKRLQLINHELDNALRIEEIMQGEAIVGTRVILKVGLLHHLVN
ncbi:MAG: histidine kinase [Saprospiraceae bacterium]|nr:histidine kinase [Saprospiraceae bacterium]